VADEVVKALSAFSETVVEKGRVRRKKRYRVKTMWEELEQAAKEKRKCMIRYKKRRKYGGGTSEYYVAPYSFRNKPGGPVLFAYDYIDGRIKSFFRDSVTGVRVTDRKFRPKWDLELSQEASDVLKALVQFSGSVWKQEMPSMTVAPPSASGGQAISPLRGRQKAGSKYIKRVLVSPGNPADPKNPPVYEYHYREPEETQQHPFLLSPSSFLLTSSP